MTTYNLQAGGGSGQFYLDISHFADCVLGYGEKYRSTINLYGRWAVQTKQDCRTDLEYALEFLSLGVYWLVYGGKAAGPQPFKGLLMALAKGRRRGGVIKAVSDKLKGILLTLNTQSRKEIDLSRDAEGLANLLSWLEASGEFNLESRRLAEWLGWLQTLSVQEAGQVLTDALEFAAWFEDISEQALGKYTAGVEEFLRQELPRRRWQENIVLCGRRPVEYHMNLVGSEILNWAYRRDFLQAKDYVVLTPRCMCKAGRKCRAVATEYGLHCTSCTPNCQVAVLTGLGKNHGFEVYIIPHETSSFARWQGPVQHNEGVIGIACATRLIEGGLKARSLGLPAQCVLLDYCGCRHWRTQEAVTSINMARINDLLGLDEEPNWVEKG